jgi:hypothetical protein
MSIHGRTQSSSLFSKAAALLTLSAFIQPVGAQNAALQQKVQEIKASQAANKAALAHYTWQEQQTISIKGEVKKVTTYQVTVGPDGQQQKTEIGGTPQAQPSGGRLKQHVIAKKKEEFEDYAQQIATLAKQYAHLDPDMLQQAVQKGNVNLQPGGEGVITLVITSLLKPNDSVTLSFDRQQKALQGLQIASYLNDPSDAVKINIQYAKIPNGPNHPATILVNGVSKQLTVNIQNSNYQPAS